MSEKKSVPVKLTEAQRRALHHLGAGNETCAISELAWPMMQLREAGLVRSTDVHGSRFVLTESGRAALARRS
jgi:hypothetical protein